MRKFKWIGPGPGPRGQFDMDLIVAGILPEGDLVPGQVIEIEDDHELVSRIPKNGNWQEIKEKGRPKKQTKEKEGG